MGRPVLQVVAVGFVISVIQDSIETALNSSGDVMFEATAEFHDKMKRGEEIEFFKKKKKIINKKSHPFS